MLYDGDIFEHDGRRFKVAFPHDDSGDTPWDRDCMSGIVSEWTTRAKAPGEHVLASDGGSYRYYDFAGTMKHARKTDGKGWGFTNGADAVKAVEADFEKLRRWCNDQWSYVGVVVTMLDENDDETPFVDSVWGVESDAYAYLEETARECAGEALSRYKAYMHDAAVRKVLSE